MSAQYKDSFEGLSTMITVGNCAELGLQKSGGELTTWPAHARGRTGYAVHSSSFKNGHLMFSCLYA